MDAPCSLLIKKFLSLFSKKLYENISFNDEIRRIKKKEKEKMLVNIGYLCVLASEFNIFSLILRFMSK